MLPSGHHVVPAAAQIRRERRRLVERLVLVRVHRGEQSLALLLVRLCRCSTRGGAVRGGFARAGEAWERRDEVVEEEGAVARKKIKKRVSKCTGLRERE